MKLLFLSIALLLSTFAYCQVKLLVTTDIGQDPDDQQSLVRLLHYADKFQLAGIIANADANYEHEDAIVKTEIIHELIDAYANIENNLRIHSPTFPSAAYLHTIVKKGCAGNGRAIPVERYVGEGKDTEGSDWIINVVDNTKNGWVAIAVWGGACDLAQALWKVKNTRSPSAIEVFVSKLKVYFIGKQDSSNQWIIDNFPQLWLILALAESGNSWASTYRGMFLGGDMSTTSRAWLNQYIIGKNPLASLYPDKAWTGKPEQNPHGAMKEGDSPSFLYFLQNGLNSPEKPHWGSWGGRFTREREQFFHDVSDHFEEKTTSKIVQDTKATVYRWRGDFQKDFAARVQWGAASSYREANHYPIIQLSNALVSNRHIEISAKPEEEIALDASLSFDPDGDQISFSWFVYTDVSSLKANHTGINITNPTSSKVSISLPTRLTANTVHVLLSVTDNHHATPLVAYKRFVIHIE